ncbi:MAG: NAD(P)-dependent oxidoreductase [bacterium]
MKKPKTTFYGIWPDMKEYIRGRMKGYSMNIITDPLTDKNIKKDTEILAVFVHSKLDANIIKQLPKLKLISTMSTGYDHIDIKTAEKKKISVCNVPVYGENTVAEHAMALMLGLSRKIFPSVKRVKEGVYDFHGLRGVDLKGKTLGVVGTGHIGMHLIRMAQGFDMNIIAFDAFPNKNLSDEHNFKYVNLNKLLAESDFISLHVPLFPTTFHIINKKNIKKIKKGSYIINTARGELIEPEALLWALEKEQIAGAGLDVMEDECYVQHEEKIMAKGITEMQIKNNLINNVIIDHPNTIITPHNAFNSTEALQRILDTTIDNIKAFVKGEVQNDVYKKKRK